MNKKFEVDILSASNFISLGFCMSGKKFSTPSYRYGFNGKEHDLEGVGGGSSTYDYGARIYNPQIGKFLSIDPLSPQYPWYTPYQFAGNKPIWAIDLDGLEEFIVTVEFGRFGDPAIKYVKFLDRLESPNRCGVRYDFMGQNRKFRKTLTISGFLYGAEERSAKARRIPYYNTHSDAQNKRNVEFGPLGNFKNGTKIAQDKFTESAEQLKWYGLNSAAPTLAEFYSENGSLSSGSIDNVYIATYLIANPNGTVNVTGFTDRVGKPDANNNLGLDRALQVKDDILSVAHDLGLSQEEICKLDARIIVTSQGENRAVSKGDADSTENANERTTEVTLGDDIKVE